MTYEQLISAHKRVNEHVRFYVENRRDLGMTWDDLDKVYAKWWPVAASLWEKACNS